MEPQTRPRRRSHEFSDVDLDDNNQETHSLAKRAATYPNIDTRARELVDDLYRNISLTPQSVVFEEALEAHRAKKNKRRKSRLRQAAAVPERVSSRKKSQKSIKRTDSQRVARLREHSDVCSMDGSDDSSFVDFSVQPETRNRSGGPSRPRASAKHVPFKSHNTGGEANFPERDIAGRQLHNPRGISLRGKSHVSLRGVQAFNLPKSKRRQPIARDWSPIRKRAVATVACISTALIGVLLGIYAGLVPSLQYYIWDSGHTILNGNVGCFLGMALPTFFCWPLPLVHGRKPYITSGLVLSMPLLFPQAVAVYAQRFENLTG
ncbi:hypothetical protein CcaCcLH18_01307 [Colletotrichum camelliae]|nr:hypothetical protein CcaCcLH18_01307 [Colletotrichum camelliae]